MSAFVLLDTSSMPTTHLHRLTERPLPNNVHQRAAAAASGAWFSPVAFRAQADSTSELLRF